MQHDKIENSADDGSGPEYAGFHARVFASIIDTAILAILLGPLFYDISGAMYAHQNPVIIFRNAFDKYQDVLLAMQVLTDSGALKLWLVNSAIQTVIMGAIIIALWVRYGGSPGKLLAGMKIADTRTFAKPTIWQSLIRFLGYFVSLIPPFLGIAWMAFNKRRQTWHDIIAGTVVIFEPEPWYRTGRLKSLYEKLRPKRSG